MEGNKIMVKKDLQVGFYKFTRPGGTQLPDLNKKYLDLFGEKRDGVFVEVGGFDGTSVSNTLPLADPINTVFKREMKI